MQTHTSGRVLPLRGGDLMAPAVCLICRRSGSDVDETFADPSELFADPQIHEDFFGSVYFCRGCSLEIAAVFGAQSNEEVAELVHERDTLLVENINLKTILKDTSDALVALRRVDGFTISPDFIGGPPVGYRAIDEAEPDSQPGLPEPTEQRADESPVITESSNGEGPDDVNESEREDVDDFLRNL